MGYETYVTTSNWRGKNENPKAHYLTADIRNYEDLTGIMDGVYVVFHLAGILSHWVNKDPERAIDVNIKGTWNVKRAAEKNGVERIIFASTSWVYGDPNYNPVDENHPAQPKDLLGVSKLAAENILRAAYICPGTTHPCEVEYVILRIFNVYGPNAYDDGLYTSVFTKWIPQALKKESLEIHDDGTQTLDFVYVEDVADAFISCMNQKAANQTFNVGAQAVNLNGLAYMINQLAENYVHPHYNVSHKKYIKWIKANTSKIETMLDWKPKTPFKEGLRKTVDYYRQVQR